MSRRPTPRTQRTVPNPFVVFLLTAIITAFLTVMAYHVYLNKRTVQNTTAPVSLFGAVRTMRDDEGIRIYIRGDIRECNLEVIGE